MAITKKVLNKLLAGGGDYPEVEIIGRYHAPSSLEGWIVLKTNNSKNIYEHVAKWAELLNLEITPVFTDEEAAPIIGKFMDKKSYIQNIK